MKRVPSVRTAFIALVGISILICLVINRQIQPFTPEKLMVGTIQQIPGTDTGCWFRFPNASDDDPIVFYEDNAAWHISNGLANINNRDISFTLLGLGKKGATYYSNSTQTYLNVDVGKVHADPQNPECIDFPKATLTFSKNQNSIRVPVKGLCGCDGGSD